MKIGPIYVTLKKNLVLLQKLEIGFFEKNFNGPAILKVTKRFIVHLSGPFVHNTLNRDYKKFQGRFKNGPKKGQRFTRY